MVDFGKAKSGEPLHPGRILLTQAMEPLGISRNQLARDIDVPVGRISDITNGKRGITADTALRLGRYFGTGPELWMRLQAEFDLYVARMTTWPSVEPRVRVLQARPGDPGDAAAESPVTETAEKLDLFTTDPAVVGARSFDREEDEEGPVSGADRPAYTAARSDDGAPPDMQDDVAEKELIAPEHSHASAGTGGNGAAVAPEADRGFDNAGDEEADLGIPPIPGQPASVS